MKKLFRKLHMQRAMTLKKQLQELLFMHLKLNWTLFMHHEIELDAINCLLLTPVLYRSFSEDDVLASL